FSRDWSSDVCSSDLSVKRVSADIPTRDNLFLGGQTDFSFGYTTAQLPLLQERCNCQLNVIRYSDYGITALSNGVVVSDALIAERSEERRVGKGCRGQ